MNYDEFDGDNSEHEEYEEEEEQQEDFSGKQPKLKNTNIDYIKRTDEGIPINNHRNDSIKSKTFVTPQIRFINLRNISHKFRT
jgi:hypothetical protein